LDQCPEVAEREQDPPQVGLVASILQAVLADQCARLQMAPNLVATSQDVKLVVRGRLQGNPRPTESLLTQGWRAQHILPALQAILDGRQNLRVADLTQPAPLAFQDAG
jgi:ribonuclease D